MSLEKIGNKLNSEIKEAELVKIKNIKEKEILSARENILRLSNELISLSLIKNSILYKKEPGSELDVLSNKRITFSNFNEKNKKISKIYEDYEEGWKNNKINNKDELLNNPEFINEPEIVEYNEAKTTKDGFNEAEAILIDKVNKIGGNFNLENFSYLEIADFIDKKIIEKERELINEKIKTTEGREEHILTTSKKIEEKLPVFEYKQDENTNSSSFKIKGDLRNDHLSISILGDRVNINKWNDYQLIPKISNDIKNIYPVDLINESIIEAYKNKTEDSIRNFDKGNGNIYLLEEELDRNSKIKYEKAKEQLVKYEENVALLKKELEAKSVLLKKQGVDFSPVAFDHGKMTYEKFVSMGSKEAYTSLKNHLNNDYSKPLNFDYNKINLIIDNVNSKLENIIEGVREIKDAEGVKNFSGDWSNSILYNNMILDESRLEPYKIASDFNISKIETEKSRNNNIDFKKMSFTELTEYKDKEIFLYNKNKKYILNKISESLDAQNKYGEFLKIKEEKGYSRYRSYEDEIKYIEHEKNVTRQFKEEIKNYIDKYNGEKIKITDRGFYREVVSGELEAIKEEIEKEETNLNNLLDLLRKDYKIEPFWNKSKWNADRIKILEKEKDLNEHLRLLINKKNQKAKEEFVGLRIEATEINKIFANHVGKSGNINNLFLDLSLELDKINNKEIDKEVTEAYDSYQDALNKMK